MLSGIKTNFVTHTPNSQACGQSFQRKPEGSDKHNLSTDIISFANINPLKYLITTPNIINNTQIAAQFGEKLLNLDNLDENILKKEISDFLELNSVKNIKIEEVSQIQVPQGQKIAGRFSPDYTDDYKLKGGTLYLGNIPDAKDKDALCAFVAVVAHELTHVLQHSKNNDNFGFKNFVSSYKEAQPLIEHTDLFKMKFEPIILFAPFQNYMDNHQQKGLTQTDFEQIAKSANDYGVPILKHSINFTQSDIETPIAAQTTLSERVNSILNASFAGYIKHYSIPTDKVQETKEGLLRHCISDLKDEYEAYQTMSDIIKKQYNIKGQSINDMAPMAYKMVLNIMNDKLKNEFDASI